MSDEMQYDDIDQSFWDDVDALRAMLEEEDSQQAKPAAPSFDVRQDPVQRAPRQAASFRIPYEDQPSGPVRSQPPVFDPRNIPQQGAPAHGHRHRRAPKRPSKGALITLYTIIIMELGAITAVAYHWYSWIQ